MNCPYCSASNAEEDHRCKRCGRRVSGNRSDANATHGMPGMPGAMPRFQHAATASALSFEPAQEQDPSPAAPETHPETGTQVRRPVYQPSLFASPRVVSFEAFAPEAVDPAPKKSSRPRQKARKILPGQQSLGFDAGLRSDAPHHHGPAAPLEPVIVCDAPVALPAHRIIAAGLDGFIIIVGISLFFSVFYFAGGQMTLNKYTLPLLVGIAAVFSLFYKVLWCLAGGDTAGMRWAHLRLVNFDGQPPEREQRLFRMASGCLSLLAAGLGLFWALVDEESLTWHDHMSKTFPTPY